MNKFTQFFLLLFIFFVSFNVFAGAADEVKTTSDDFETTTIEDVSGQKSEEKTEEKSKEVKIVKTEEGKEVDKEVEAKEVKKEVEAKEVKKEVKKEAKKEDEIITVNTEPSLSFSDTDTHYDKNTMMGEF